MNIFQTTVKRPLGSAANAARIEMHAFDSMTLTDRQFLKGEKQGQSARIAGELRLPFGNGAFPAVVLVHGSGGVELNVILWAEQLNRIGVATFVMDCFTGRGIQETITDQSRLGHLSMIVDAYHALELLSKHPQIDVTRIGVMGFSKGGFVALYSSMTRFQRYYAPADLEFSIYIPFYARCDTPYLEDENLSNRPIRLFHGVDDDYVPIEACRQYVQRLRRAGKDVRLLEYTGAHHNFDNPAYLPIQPLPDAETPNHCRREERPGGVIINIDTGQPFSMKDDCVTRGATVGYSKRAHAESVKAVVEILKNEWRLE